MLFLSCLLAVHDCASYRANNVPNQFVKSEQLTVRRMKPNLLSLTCVRGWWTYLDTCVPKLPSPTPVQSCYWRSDQWQWLLPKVESKKPWRSTSTSLKLKFRIHADSDPGNCYISTTCLNARWNGLEIKLPVFVQHNWNARKDTIFRLTRRLSGRQPENLKHPVPATIARNQHQGWVQGSCWL